MFKRLHWDMGMDWIPKVAFVVFFVIFIGVVIYAIRMSKKEVDRLGSLPLDDEKIHEGKKSV
ncbi:MAG: CcoQ/FixQ family Cbb3-type cytochrome c oxidase assembly chaperone [Verrucomicrobiota bacterium]